MNDNTNNETCMRLEDAFRQPCEQCGLAGYHAVTVDQRHLAVRAACWEHWPRDAITTQQWLVDLRRRPGLVATTNEMMDWLLAAPRAGESLQ